MTKRVLGVDLGDVRTGIAISDPLGMLAGGVATVKECDRERLADTVARYAEKYEACAVVLGFPVNMDGSRSNRADATEAFAELLRKRLTVPILLLDERCTTMLSHRILQESGVYGKKRKAAVDTLSAEIILQNYLDKMRRESETSPSETIPKETV